MRIVVLVVLAAVVSSVSAGPKTPTRIQCGGVEHHTLAPGVGAGTLKGVVDDGQVWEIALMEGQSVANVAGLLRSRFEAAEIRSMDEEARSMVAFLSSSAMDFVINSRQIEIAMARCVGGGSEAAGSFCADTEDCSEGLECGSFQARHWLPTCGGALS